MQDQFEIENGILKAYTGTDAEIQVPEGVHTIGDDTFKGMAWILKVSLPSTLVKIGDRAFKGCRQMKEITFPEGLAEIGEYAFHKCHCVEELIFPKSMTKAGAFAFLYCDGLKKVVMEGPEHLGKAVFSHNLSLQEIHLAQNMDDSNFSDEVFEGCVQLSRICLSGKIYELSNLIEAMNSHSSFPAVIRSIAKSVFHTMEIEDGVLNKFSINLKTVFLPEGITAIGKSCFFDKKGIVNIILPKSAEEIRANAFLNCISLEEITIPREDIKLDDKAFRGCSNLKKVHLKDKTYLLDTETENETVCRIRDQVNADFYISGSIMIRYMGKEEQITIPDGVEVIGERCFFGNENIKIVTCPESLLEIREQAFSGCATLQGIVLPDKLKRIEREAFAECRKLLKCNLPQSMEYIGEYAFRRCMILKLFDPWPVSAEIHPYAFYRAKHFGKVTDELQRKNKKDIADENCGRGKNADAEVAAYAFLKKEGIKNLVLKGITRIGRYAYASCPDLEEVEIDAPDCVIETDAFAACPKLKKITLHVREIGKACFSYCGNLTEVHISGVFCLPAECFAGCHRLRIFDAREITRMEERCFDECTNLDRFDFNGIRSIGERAFERCDSLKNVKLDRTKCAFHAFADCASLETIEITKDTVLKSGVFIGCTQVKTIVYGSEEYEFSKFADSRNHTNNPYPVPVREVIASIYSCFDIQDGKLLVGYSQDATEVTIPQDVEEIGQDVFRDHIRLKEIHIPESVKKFGSHAFGMTAWMDAQREQVDMVIVNGILLDGAKCSGKVVIPDTVKRVAAWCFAGNFHITELQITSDRIAIENLAFRNCLNLKKITDHQNKEYVLKNVADLKEKEYPELVQRIFTECLNCYKLDENNTLIESTGNITELNFPEGIRAIGDGVYKDCHLLECIALSTDTVQIGKCAFENGKWLKQVTNAAAVEVIGAQAFSGCQSLETIDLSDRLRVLGKRCFEHCCSLREIHISDQLEMIPERSFFRCKSLEILFIPAAVDTIEKEAFAFCDTLKDVYVSEKTSVADTAFAYCDNVKIHRYAEGFDRDDFEKVTV